MARERKMYDCIIIMGVYGRFTVGIFKNVKLYVRDILSNVWIIGCSI